MPSSHGAVCTRQGGRAQGRSQGAVRGALGGEFWARLQTQQWTEVKLRKAGAAEEAKRSQRQVALGHSTQSRLQESGKQPGLEKQLFFQSKVRLSLPECPTWDFRRRFLELGEREKKNLGLKRKKRAIRKWIRTEAHASSDSVPKRYLMGMT